MLRQILVVGMFLAVLGGLPAQYRTLAPGDGAVADKYVQWIQRAIEEGRWVDAQETLLRANDFIDVSSDLSYLKAVVGLREQWSRRLILQALRHGIEVDRWNRYNADAARLLEAETLIHIHAFSSALESLSRISPTAVDFRSDTTIGDEVSYLRLRALLGLKDFGAFRDALGDSLERYAWDPRPIRLLFQYGAQKKPEGPDLALINTALRRLSVLQEADPDLAYLAAPFIKDTDESRRLIASYRALGGSNPRAIPAALEVGLIDEETAIRELFKPLQNSTQGLILDKSLIFSVFGLLRHTEGRESFGRNLIRFSGVLLDDTDKDGISEAYTRYQDGQIQEYIYDADQDGAAEWRILFRMGVPVWAEIGLPAEPEGERAKAIITWEQYPWVVRAVLETGTFIFRPRDFTFTPLRFTEIGGSFPLGLLYPDPDSLSFRLTKRALAAFATAIEQPSREFEGAVERIELARGIPLHSAEYFDGRTVSVMEFLFGRPRTQRVDRDLDGRLETIRYFHQEAPPPVKGEGLPELYPFDYKPLVKSSESDWDGDGIYETGEEYFSDGTVNRSWDITNDGIKEFTLYHIKE